MNKVPTFICPHCQYVHAPGAPCLGSSKLSPDDPPARAMELLRSLCFSAERFMEYVSTYPNIYQTKAWKELHEVIEETDTFLGYYAKTEQDREERRDEELIHRNRRGPAR